MRAILSEVVGGIDSLKLAHAAIPEAGEGEILVKVRACGINFPDSLIIQDLYQVKHPRPFSPGSEISGEVVAIGPHVTAFSVGDAIMGTLDHGGLAEYARLPAVRCLKKPSAMPYDEAAAFLLTYGTSYHALHQRGKISAGETLLVLGAAGGVGIAAVQLGVAAGARVIAAASTEEKVEFAMRNGAESKLVYPMGPFDKDGRKALAAMFKDAVGQASVDVIYDGVGGAYAEASLRSIAREGRFLVVGFPAGIPSLPLNLALLKECQVVGVHYGAWKNREPEKDHRNKAALIRLYEEGKLRPQVSDHYPLERASEAISKLASRGALGKVVVLIE